MRLSVSGVSDLPSLAQVGAVISIRDPGDDRPQALEALDVPLLELVFHDSEDARDALDQPPEAWQLERVQRFLDGLKADDTNTVLHIHCYAGVSRSTAVACFVLASLYPALSDARIIEKLLEIRPQATPNRLLLKHTDELLGRKLSRAWNRLATRYF